MKFPRGIGRAGWLYIGLSAWFVVVAAALLVPAWLRRGELLAAGDRMALRNGLIPAPRGAVRDADGVRLAWSERYFDLFYTGAAPGEDRVVLEAVANMLENVTPPVPGDPLPWRLAEALTPADYHKVRELVAQSKVLGILSRTERLTLDDPELRRRLGAVAIDPETGVMSGMSGIEAERNAVLSGVSGEYRVEVDARGNWVRPTLEILVQPVPGDDVRLEYGWREWLRRVDGADEI